MKILFFITLFVFIYHVTSRELVFSWKTVTYADAPTTALYNPTQNIPTGVAYYRGRVFISVPRRLGTTGIPSTLNWVKYDRLNPALDPPLSSYPDYNTNIVGVDVSKIISVWRPVVDACKRLWIVDTGFDGTVQQHRPTIWVFNLRNDTLARRYIIPITVVPDLNARDLVSITVDVEINACDDAYAYIASSTTNILPVANPLAVVYSLKQNNAWHFTSPTFAIDLAVGAQIIIPPTPPVPAIPVILTDGLYSFAVGKRNKRTRLRKIYYHPLASFNEYAVSNAVLKNVSLSPNLYGIGAFSLVGSRGLGSQATISVTDRFGVTFYGQIQTNSITCWNTGKTLSPTNIGTIDSDDTALLYPSDLDIDSTRHLWVLTNNYLRNRIPANVVVTNFNFYIYKYNIRAEIRNTICEPDINTLLNNDGFKA